MSKERKIIPLFTTPIVKTNIGRDFTKDEMRCLSTIPMIKNEKENEVNHISKDRYLFDNFTEELEDIKKFCEHHLKIYLEEVDGINTNFAKLRITQSWLTKTKPQEHMNKHVHPNSYLSGVLYISCLLNDGINFTQQLQGSYGVINMIFPMKKTTGWNANVVKIDIEEGDLVIFPSWVIHHIDVNETKNKERISLAFNTFPIGELGDHDSLTHLKLDK